MKRVLDGGNLGAVTPLPPAARPAAKVYSVVVDAGHGGVDPGCIGRAGTYEKDVVLDTAMKLARGLEATKRYKISMSRSSDDFVSLEDRVIRARTIGADLFISVHADALPQRSERGASVFTLSEKASDREAALVAQRENDSDRVAGVKYTADPRSTRSCSISRGARPTISRCSWRNASSSSSATMCGCSTTRIARRLSSC